MKERSHVPATRKQTVFPNVLYLSDTTQTPLECPLTKRHAPAIVLHMSASSTERKEIYV
jgi:hypothetical protein